MEIQAKDLRIGNWIADYGCEPYFFQVEQIRKNVGYELWAYYRDGTIKAKDVEPIPLTEEWADKLPEDKFDFVGFGTRIIYQCVKYPAIKYESGHNAIMVYFNDEPIRICKYVHEWQNIHHALTGEELEIKEDNHVQK
jgi:hypothetical protein